MMENTVLISIFVLSLIACSGSGGGGGINSKTGPNLQNVEKNEIIESYHLVLNGCDTGEHVFTTGSIEETRKQLCEAYKTTN